MMEVQGETDPAVHAWRQVEFGGRNIAANRRKDVLLLFDGEIFHKDELIQRMKGQGKTCNSRENEDLILDAYELFGEKCFQYLDGDFAIAILDKTKMKLLLARDRVGKKPLYWGQEGGNFLFASELKALLVTGIISQSLSLEALATYLAFGFFPQDSTPIQKINKLLPGYYLVFEEFKTLRIESFWSLSSHFGSSLNLKPEEIAENLGHLLNESVKQRVEGKKEVGCYLSGGLGSASVGWFLKRGEHSLKAFTAGFSGENDADLETAAVFAKNLHMPQATLKIDPSHFLVALPQVLWQVEEPIADPNLITTWHLSKMPCSGMTLFSGMGSDELLAGHNRYTLEERGLGRFESFFAGVSDKVKRVLIPLLYSLGSTKAYDLLREIRVNPYLAQYVHQNLLFPRRNLPRLSPLLAPLFDPIVFLEKFHHLSKIQSAVSAFIYLDFKTRLPDYFIQQFEKLTFASGLGWATPFLDKQVIEFATRIPEPETLTEVDTGNYLRRLMRPHFAAEVIDRPKKSRRSFLSTWASDPHILPYLIYLQDSSLIEMGFVEKKWVEKALSTPQTRSQNFRQLFALLILEAWIRLFILQPIQSHPKEISLHDLLTRKVR
jgi:asparagine synthase (glutamine-hydrolysing)